MTKPDILICGAGPSGLVLALSLRLQNVPFRIIDASSGPGLHSRAMGLHARTLELYRSFGIGDQVAKEGIHTQNAHVRVLGSSGKPFEVAQLPFSTIGAGVSRYPYILQYPQDHHERLLTDHLAELGVDIERNTQLISLVEGADGISVLLDGPRGEEKATYRYVCGCDGAHSKVRRSIDVHFSGGTYTQPFFVADVKLAGDFSDDFIVTLSSETICVRMPVRKTGMTRLIGLVPKEIKDQTDIRFDHVKDRVESLLACEVAQVNWFSPYHVHHRVADAYRKGNVFLCGDSAHVHSPLGGQGMNTGIGDAINLAWKLAYVKKGRASEALLDSYESERRPFGVKLVNTTDRAFSIVMQANWVGQLIRRFLWPMLVAVITRIPVARRNAFRFMSQIHISYEHSEVSEGIVGSVKAGERLPWVDYGNGKDNFEPFDGINWQIHIYGCAHIDLEELDWIAVHSFPYDNLAKKVGLQEDAAYLIRPDTYTALVMNSFDLDKLRSYVARLHLSA